MGAVLAVAAAVPAPPLLLPPSAAAVVTAHNHSKRQPQLRSDPAVAHGCHPTVDQERCHGQGVSRSQDTKALRRFYEWHIRHDKDLADVTLERATTILGELSRSVSHKSKVPSNYPIWKDCTNKLFPSIKDWKMNHRRFQDARALRPMPYLPLPGRLEAFKYLDPKSKGMPTRIIAGFEELGLSAYINGGPLLGTWWSRADLSTLSGGRTTWLQRSRRSGQLFPWRGFSRR